MKAPGTVVVVGGGIAGLAAARRLTQTLPDARVVLIERARALGGKIATQHIDGFTIEGGPDSFLASKPAGLEFCREIGIEHRLQETREDTRGSFIMRAGGLYPIPAGLSGLVPARLEPLMDSELLSNRGKRRVAAEETIPASSEEGDESLGSFIRRRFGGEVYDRLIEPLMSGIYAGNGDELSVLATFPNLKELERRHGSVLNGLKSTATATSRSKPVGFLAPRAGMSEIVDAALSSSAVDVLLESRVSRVHGSGSGFRIALDTGNNIDADALVVATPAPAAAEILEPLRSPLSSLLAGIPHVSTTTVSLGFARNDIPHGLHGHGYIVPRGEGHPVLACTWVSSKWKHRAPPDSVLLRLFLGRAGLEGPAQAADPEVEEMAREEVRRTMGVVAAPSLVRIFRWPNAMPQYQVGHLDVTARIEHELRSFPGLALAGNYLSGVGIPDCIDSGCRAADAVATALHTSSIQKNPPRRRVPCRRSGGPDRI